MHPHSLLLLLPILLQCSLTPSHASAPDGFSLTDSTKYFEVTHSLPTDYQRPTYSLTLLEYDFGDSVLSPPVSVNYSPPCSCKWAAVVVDFAASCVGKQLNRIAAVWIDGIEILRTSTPQPTGQGVFWKVKKDVTKYASVLQRSNATVSVMLQNQVNETLTGIFHVNVSLHFYRGRTLRLPSEDLGTMDKRVNSNTLYGKPADLIIPISNDVGDHGFWYGISSGSDKASKEIKIPVNTYRAVLEIYASSHSNDETWYSNPPQTFLLQTKEKGNGAFRNVFATVDGLYVGSILPFPVVYTGAINPLFWNPVVAIGAFDLPSYDLDLTPFLGNLLDGELHSISLSVANAKPFWLVNANLHLWIDSASTQVKAKLVDYRAPLLTISRDSKYEVYELEFKIQAKSKTHFAGWVFSSFGNLTTRIVSEIEFENQIQMKREKDFKEVEQKIKEKREITIVQAYPKLEIAKAVYVKEYPLKIKNETDPKKTAYLTATKFIHERKEQSDITFSSGKISITLDNYQESNSRKLVENDSVLSDVGTTRQKYKYRDGNGCYLRNVASKGGEVMEDNSSNDCLQAM